MKKLMIAIMALTLLMAFSLPANAVTDGEQNDNVITFGTSNTEEYGLSNNVYMDYDVGSTNNQDFALGDKHMSGNREYYTTNQTTLIYYFESDDYKGKTTLSGWTLDPGATTVDGEGEPL
ncbi:MAG: hypothetical protein ACLFVT_10105 [Syntrophobacteria bacterium]